MTKDEEMDEILPDEEGGSVGITTVIAKEEPKEEKKPKPRKEEIKKASPEEMLYDRLENIPLLLTIAIDKGNSTLVWREMEDILKEYKKLFL